MGGPWRGGVLLALRSCGRFDARGDTFERKAVLWRHDAGAPAGALEDRGG